MSRLLTDDMAPETLTDADFEPETDAPETLTDADFEPETDAPETLTEADFEPETDAPETLTEADMAEAAGTFHPDQLKTDWADVAPSFGQASAGAANAFRMVAQGPLTLADKGMAAAGLGLRMAEGAGELAGMGPEGGKSRARAGLEGLRENLAEWREENLGQRNAEGKPTTEFWETIGGQAANAATEIFLMRGIGAGLGKIKAGTAAGKAAQAGKAGAAAGKAASVWQRLRPSSVTKLYLLSQAEATAGKAEDAGMGRAQQLALGAVTGTWEAAMESVSQIFGAQAAMSPEVRGGVARAIRRALVDTLFEGSGEALQEGGTATVEKLAGLDERTWAQIAADAARAFTVGAVTGAAIGGANTAAEAAMGRRMREQFGARLRAAETGGLGTAERRQVTEAGGLGPLARQAANIADLTQAEGRANEGELSGEAAQRPDVEAAQEAQGQPAASGADGRAELPAGRQAADGELSLQERRDRATLVTADAPRRRFQRNVSDDMLENDPVRAHVILLGGVRPDGTEDQSGIPTVFLARKGHGQRLDQMLVELRGMGLEMVRDWTTDDLREHLLGKRSGYKPPARQKTAEYEAERDWYKSGSVAVFPSNLALGYTFTVRGQAYEVADADADGYILVPAGADADGYALRLAPSGAMQIDKGSLRAPGGKAVRKLAEVADAATLEMFRRGERERDAAAREELALLGFPVDERAEEAGEAAEAGFRVQGSEDTAGLPTLADINTDDDVPFAPRPGQAVSVEVDDAAYMDAVERGDTETAQRMVDEAANSALELMRGRWQDENVSSFAYVKRGDITLYEIRLPKERRGQGIGTAKMRELLEFAQKHGMRVLLSPSTDFGASSKARLEKFYRGLGFEKNSGRNRDYRTRETMIWRPAGYVKSADPVTRDAAGRVIPLSERFNEAEDDIRFAPRPGQAAVSEVDDAAYMAAVEAGDTETAQRMVDEAAKRAGFTVGPVWHGTDKEAFTVFRPGWRESAIFFATNKDNAWKYARGVGASRPEARVLSAFLRIANPRDTKTGTYPITDSRVGEIKAQGFDGIVDTVRGEAIVFDPNQIKSADPITRDDAGRVIPLSERFNEAEDDIRFAPRPGQAVEMDADYLRAVEAGDRGGDNLVELLRKTEKDERDKAVAAWLERNPETAKRFEKMVVDRARAAGYTTVGYHGARTGKLFHVFDGGKHFFSSDPEVAKRFAQEGEFVLVIDGEETPISRDTLLSVLIEPYEDVDWHLGWNWVEEKGTYSDRARSNLSDWFPQAESAESVVVRKSEAGDFVLKGYLNLGDFGEQDYNGKIWSANNDSPDVMIGNKDGFVARNIREGGPTAEPEFPVADTIVVAAPSQIKSADPVTYDDAGRIIPPSERFNEAEDDIRFAPRPGQAVSVEGSPAPAAAAAVPAAPAAPAARGLTVIRRGYDAARTAADDPEYSRLARHPLDLPELVELAEDLMAGRTPRVVRQVNPAGWAAGSVRFGGERDAEGRQVYGRPIGMKLHKDNYRLVSAEEVAAWRAEAEAKYGPGEAAEAAVAETLRQETATRIKAGPRLAMKVIAHEIGHIADQMTRYGIPKLDRSKSANRLNLLGRVAGAIAHTRGIISADPAGKTLSPDEARVLAGQARRNARPDSQGRELFRAVANVWGEILQAHPEYEGAVSARELQHTLEVMRDTYPALSEWFQITTFQEQTRAVEDALRAFAEPGTQAREARRMGGAWFRQAFVAGLEARRQAHLKQMYSELEALIAWWNGGDRTMMDEYYKAPGEMFADAFGVWLNNPGAVQKRAPMFYTTLVAYMDTRPEVQEWLQEFDEMLDSGGDVRDRRIGRIRRFFSEDTRRQRRQVYELARKKVKGRTASDMAAYIGWSKSSPLRAVLRQAERMGHKALADQGSEMADRIENLRGLEELYRAMNIEIGRVLDEGGLNVEDFDTYALLDMVARSPAYVDKANPHGLHPEAARQTLARMREQMGDAAANTLARAVETSQQIWQSEIVAPLEQYGGYDPGLIKFMRENPIYFTLQVGMDDAELAEWNKALQSGDKEAVSAAAMRAIEHGLPGGQRVTGEIHTRQGTHRPAMSLLGATMLKGEALLSAAMHNEAMRQGEELLKAANDPMYAPIDENNKTARDTAMQVVLSYRVVAEDAEGTPRSKTVRYYAPRYVGHFLRGDNPASAANRVLQGTKFYLAHRTLKLWQTMASFRFIVTQPHADRKAWNTQMPGVRTPLGNIARGHLIGGLAQMIPAATWILPPSFFPRQSRERLMRPMRDLARAYYRTGKIDPKLRKLIERGMYDLGGAWQGVGQDNPHPGEVIGTSSPMQTTPKSFATFEAESGRAVKAMQKIGSLPVIRTIMRGFHWSQDAMYAETLANKLAGMAYLDEKYPDMPERQKREWVLKAAGNPNFASRGAGDPFIDTFAWAFYNPAKEGFRSLAYSARHDPLGFAIRTSYYNLLPNLITKLAATGLLAEGLRRIMPHGDSPEDEEKRERFLAAFARWTSLFGRINSYYGRRHVAIPILPVGTDSALTITVPQAQSFAPINSLINVGLDELAQAGGLDPDDDKATENIIQAISDEIPGVPFMYGQTRGMIEQTVGPILTMMLEGNTNVYDPFYQRFILDRDEEDLMRGGKWKGRALPAWSKLAKNAYNSAFGSMLGRFDTKTPRADNAAKTELQKIITAPGVGALVGGWIRVTGGGESESIRELLAPETAEQAAMSIKARNAAVETLNSPDGTFPTWAAEMYATDPAFAKTYNRFRARAQAYSNLTPAQRMIYTKSNPKWKRQLILESELERQLRARE